MKRPAASAASTGGDEGEDKVNKKPASKGGTKTKKDGSASIGQSFYKVSGKYSWKVNGKECFHAAGAHIFLLFNQSLTRNDLVSRVFRLESRAVLKFPKLHPVDGISAEKLLEIAASWLK